VSPPLIRRVGWHLSRWSDFQWLVFSGEGEGDAGRLAIATGRLLVRDGAQLSASTLGTGKWRDVKCDASDTVEVIGTQPMVGFVVACLLGQQVRVMQAT
jgi:hypothetical protein